MRVTCVWRLAFDRACVCFQAEDGIRDKLVTGVQTCSLPILYSPFDTSARADVSNGLYNTIVIKIENIAEWAQQDSANDPSKLNLFLDGNQINVNTIKIDRVRESELSYVLFPRNATEE